MRRASSVLTMAGLTMAGWSAMAAGQQAQTPAVQSPAAPPPAAQQGEESPISDEPDIIVTGQRGLPGAVIGDIPPEQQLGPADIRSYGVSSVADLLTELAPQTRSGVGGAPVVLLNGKRIAGFQEIRDIPTEAIARVDILPEEVALKYGYRADQRVVNIVLRRRFRATTVELADRQATEGGRNSPQVELDRLSIRNGGRFNLHSQYQQSSALTEAERDIATASADAGSTPPVDQRSARTLLPFSRTFSTNAVYARPVGKVSATVNGRIEASQSNGLNGLAGGVIGGAVLDQRSETVTGHLGTTLNGLLGGGWNWSLTGGYDRIHGRSLSETGAVSGNRGISDSSTGQADLLVTGSPFSLPAGAVTTSVRVGATTSDFDSRSYRNGLVQTGAVSRDVVNGRVNVDLPIASRSKDVLGWIGNLSLNGNAAVDQLSDFGTLTTIGFGANWSPVEAVRVIGSVSDQDEAPSAAQLGNPSLITPNVRVFDYVRGETATVTTVTGGNPGLTADNRHVAKLGVTVKPWHDRDLVLTANYTSTRTDDPIASFPAATAAIEAAFPDRFTRDAAGTLVRIDTRPINFALSERSELRWGINFSKPIKSRIQKQIEAWRAGTGPNPFAGLRVPGQGRPGEGRSGGGRQGEGRQGEGGGRRSGNGDGALPPGAAPPPGDGGAASPAAGGAAGVPGGAAGAPGGRSPDGPGGGFGGRGFGGGGFGGGGFRGGGFGGSRGQQGGGRMQFALYHTWHLTDRVLVADGGPSLDLLDGDAIGASGGQPRHELEGQAGYTNNGLGARLSVNYASGTRVDGGTPSAPEPLRFSALTTANLRLFADLGGRLEWVKAHPWLRGTRFTLALDNLFDSRQRVTTSSGTTPVSYQPDYLDPLGRTVRLSVRKLFF